MAYTDDIDRAVRGRVAETLVEKLFQVSSYRVRSFGQECRVADEISIHAPVTPMRDKERLKPDLIVRKGKGETYLVEVKYCRNGILVPSDDFVLQCSLYPEMKVVIVNATERPFFRVISHPFFIDGKLIEPEFFGKCWIVGTFVYNQFELWIKRNVRIFERTI